jgi:hypothetical protein
MRPDRSTLIAFGILLITASLFRVAEWRFFAFAPQIAMAIFGGAVIKDKKLAFFLPILSLFISDLLYQVLYMNGMTAIPGFYDGQLINYVLFAALTVFGFAMKRINVINVAAFAISGSMLYFIASNFVVWLGGGGFARPKTFDGLMLCYNDALAFYREYGLIKGFAGNFLLGDIFFMALFFGAYYLLSPSDLTAKAQRREGARVAS